LGVEQHEQAGEAVFGLEVLVVQQPAGDVPAVLVVQDLGRPFPSGGGDLDGGDLLGAGPADEPAGFCPGRAPIMQAGEDTLMPIAIPLQAMLPLITSYAVVVKIDGSELDRLEFRVISDPQLLGVGGPSAMSTR
jgi:hypothetical protein